MNTPPTARTDVCAVVVTYFPEPDCPENLVALAPQVGKLVIVDNGSSAQSLRPVEAAAQQLGATIVRLGSNKGIATALNVGLRFAREHGFQWLATFDQDSQATPDMIEEMFRALQSYPHPDAVALVAACPIDRRLGFAVKYPVAEMSGAGWRTIPCAGTSGNLVNVRAAGNAGGFDDSLFIDYVDFEFCLRLRRMGYQVLEATRAQLLHSVGRTELRFFKRLPVTNHAAVRRYYISRNRLIVWRQYWKYEPAWLTLDCCAFLLEVLLIVVYEKQRRTKVPMIIRGLRDGLRDVRGAYRPEH